MNANLQDFDFPCRNVCRIAVGALALLGLCAILAATLQIMEPVLAGAPVPRVTVVAYASSFQVPDDDARPPEAAEGLAR